MKAAYADSSIVVAIAFDERGAAALAKRVKGFELLFSAPLLEAEVRSALHREQRVVDDGLLTPLRWVHPDRPLRPEIIRVLEAGSVRGADCWHLATALYLAPEPSELAFLTLDQRQREVASVLGFVT